MTDEGERDTMAPTRPTILLIDDCPDFCGDLAALMSEQFHAETALCWRDARVLLHRFRPDAVLLDVDLGEGESGLDVLVEIQALDDAPPVVMLTGDRRIATAVQAVRLGARDYLTKPPDPGEVARVLLRSLGDEALRRRVEALEREAIDLRGDLVAADPVMLRLVKQIEQVAPTDATVLVTGESGTGKELVARRIHDLSGRARGPFVAVNCAAVPSELMESELFGHEKGAFTGATTLKHGAFEQARGGTLFLDELGDAPPALQAKLLRALEDYSFRRVGGTVLLQADVRIVAATSLDVDRMVRDGGLRRELYYRLNVVRLHLPPLRDRPADVMHLARYFLARFSRRLRKPVRDLSPAAVALLQAYEWPGNVRELRNAIERAVIFNEGALLEARWLRDDPAARAASARPYEEAKALALEAFKYDFLASRLETSDGNVTRAAEASGLSRQSFSRMCAEVGLDPRAFGSSRGG